MDFLVEDAKGNKVFRQSVPASDFGIAAVDFILADMVNQGNYRLSAAIGQTASEKTVEVRPYVLPKFGLAVNRTAFYLPQRVEVRPGRLFLWHSRWPGRGAVGGRGV